MGRWATKWPGGEAPLLKSFSIAIILIESSQVCYVKRRKDLFSTPSLHLHVSGAVTGNLLFFHFTGTPKEFDVF